MLQMGGIDFTNGPWNAGLQVLGWALLVLPAIAWFAGQIGVWRKGRNIGFYTPVFTAFVGFMILNKLQRWPF
jgi:hypothetical protein